MKNYRFRTSLGCVRIRFGFTTFQLQAVRGKFLRTIAVNGTKEFEWVEGKEVISQLYDFNNDAICIIKDADDSLWFTIELRDSFHGVPEYLLETSGAIT